jgi:hypothetical protein
MPAEPIDRIAALYRALFPEAVRVSVWTRSQAAHVCSLTCGECGQPGGWVADVDGEDAVPCELEEIRGEVAPTPSEALASLLAALHRRVDEAMARLAAARDGAP